MAATIYVQGVEVESVRSARSDFPHGSSMNAKQPTSPKMVEGLQNTQSEAHRSTRPEDLVDCLTVSHLLARDLPIEADETRFLFCTMTVTDSQMGKQVMRTRGIKSNKSSGSHAWKEELEFHRYHGNPETMLLTIEIFLRSWFLRRRRLLIANLTLDVQNDDEFEDDSPQASYQFLHPSG
eukprot:3801749-Rhodomonas_salina.2